VNAYQEAVNETVAQNNVGQGKRISVFADNWSRWIAGAGVTTLDLLAGLGLGTGPKLDWRPWRLPLALAAAVLVINAVALNIDWWRMKGETNSLRVAMVQIFKFGLSERIRDHRSRRANAAEDRGCQTRFRAGCTG